MGNELRLSEACMNGELLVSYIYDEETARSRSQFEEHLLECESCRDEFAGYAITRYSVVEWRQIEFDPMPTPSIVIPTRSENPIAAWFSALASVFSTGPRLATAGAFAALLAFIAIGFYLNGTKTFEVTGLIPELEESSIINADPDIPKMASNPSSRSQQDPMSPVAAKTVRKVDLMKTSSVSVRTNAIPRRSVSRGVSLKHTSQEGVQRTQPLRLNDFDDYSDTSLRLADLVADIGSDE